MTSKPESLERSVTRSSVMPSLKYSCSTSPLRLTKGSTMIEGLSGSGSAALGEGVELGTCKGLRGERGAEAVRPPGAGLDELRGPPRVAEGSAELANAGDQRRVAHDHARPHRRKDFVFAHQLSMVLGQIAQDRQGFVGEAEQLLPAPE